MHLTHPYLLAFVWWHLFGGWLLCWYSTRTMPIAFGLILFCMIGGGAAPIVVPIAMLEEWLYEKDWGRWTIERRTKP